MAGACVSCGVATDRVCSVCRMAWYCTKECQARDREGHRGVCDFVVLKRVEAGLEPSRFSCRFPIPRGAESQKIRLPGLAPHVERVLRLEDCRNTYTVTMRDTYRVPASPEPEHLPVQDRAPVRRDDFYPAKTADFGVSRQS